MKRSNPTRFRRTLLTGSVSGALFACSPGESTGSVDQSDDPPTTTTSGSPTTSSGDPPTTADPAGDSSDSGVAVTSTGDPANPGTTAVTTTGTSTEDSEGTTVAGCVTACDEGESTCDSECDPPLDTCSDGELDPTEQCDTDGCGEGCFFRSRRVFVSSELLEFGDGDQLSTIAAADALCQELAVNAKLVLQESTGIKFRAWLSTTDLSPSSLFQADLFKKMPYVLVDGTLIAESWSDVLDGTLNHPISRDEHGEQTAYTSVWTGTNHNGKTELENGVPVTCDDWSVTNATGEVGLTSHAGEGWTSWGAWQCKSALPIYCFQDVP